MNDYEIERSVRMLIGCGILKHVMKTFVSESGKRDLEYLFETDTDYYVRGKEIADILERLSKKQWVILEK